MALDRVRAWTIGHVACLLIAGCRPHQPSDRAPGPVGYASDRAHELRVTVEGTIALPASSTCARDVRMCAYDPWVDAAVAARLQEESLAADARDEPLFLDRSVTTTRFSLEPGAPLEPRSARFEIALVSFARDEERRAKTWPYPPRDGLRFDGSAALVLDELLPRFASPDGRSRVTLVFGQLGKKELWPDDSGFWSADEATRLLVARGFVSDGNVLRRGGIEVQIVRPSVARLRSSEAAEAVRRALEGSDVVYVSGHARSGLFDQLPTERGQQHSEPKLVFVDTCWSYALETNALRAAYPRATLVVTDGRVTTGSVAVVPTLLDAAMDRHRSRPWLTRINDAAARRAAQRREDRTLAPALHTAEVYGLVPPSR